MNKLSQFIQCFGNVKCAFLASDNSHAAKTRLVLSYEYFGRDEKRRGAIEATLLDYVPRLHGALSGRKAILLVNAAQEEGFFEFRFELLGDELGHFTIYNVPVPNTLISEFTRYSGEELEVEFRAVTNHLLKEVVFSYSFSQEEFQEAVEGGFENIDPAAALALAATVNHGILDRNKRER